MIKSNHSAPIFFASATWCPLDPIQGIDFCVIQICKLCCHFRMAVAIHGIFLAPTLPFKCHLPRTLASISVIQHRSRRSNFKQLQKIKLNIYRLQCSTRSCAPPGKDGGRPHIIAPKRTTSFGPRSRCWPLACTLVALVADALGRN